MFETGTGCDNDVNALAVQSDGKIIIGGNFTSYNNIGRNRIARLNADGVSIDETKISDFDIYPSPTSGFFSVETEISKGTYQLFDITGKALLQGTVASPKFTLDISSLSSGVYFISITDGQRQVNGKVVKQ